MLDEVRFFPEKCIVRAKDFPRNKPFKSGGSGRRNLSRRHDDWVENEDVTSMLVQQFKPTTQDATAPLGPNPRSILLKIPTTSCFAYNINFDAKNGVLLKNVRVDYEATGPFDIEVARVPNIWNADCRKENDDREDVVRSSVHTRSVFAAELDSSKAAATVQVVFRPRLAYEGQPGRGTPLPFTYIWLKSMGFEYTESTVPLPPRRAPDQPLPRVQGVHPASKAIRAAKAKAAKEAQDGQTLNMTPEEACVWLAEAREAMRRKLGEGESLRKLLDTGATAKAAGPAGLVAQAVRQRGAAAAGRTQPQQQDKKQWKMKDILRHLDVLLCDEDGAAVAGSGEQRGIEHPRVESLMRMHEEQELASGPSRSQIKEARYIYCGPEDKQADQEEARRRRSLAGVKKEFARLAQRKQNNKPASVPEWQKRYNSFCFDDDKYSQDDGNRDPRTRQPKSAADAEMMAWEMLDQDMRQRASDQPGLTTRQQKQQAARAAYAKERRRAKLARLREITREHKQQQQQQQPKQKHKSSSTAAAKPHPFTVVRSKDTEHLERSIQKIEYHLLLGSGGVDMADTDGLFEPKKGRAAAQPAKRKQVEHDRQLNGLLQAEAMAREQRTAQLRAALRREEAASRQVSARAQRQRWANQQDTEDTVRAAEQSVVMSLTRRESVATRTSSGPVCARAQARPQEPLSKCPHVRAKQLKERNQVSAQVRSCPRQGRRVVFSMPKDDLYSRQASHQQQHQAAYHEVRPDYMAAHVPRGSRHAVVTPYYSLSRSQGRRGQGAVVVPSAHPIVVPATAIMNVLRSTMLVSLSSML